MEENYITNFVELRGTMLDTPAFSHRLREENFYTFQMQVTRLSKAVDSLNVIVREDLLSDFRNCAGQRIHLQGELRSFNNKSGIGPKLVISVFAKELKFSEDFPDCNSVLLRGTICKPPSYRTTPMGREICDLMLAVNRKYGRSDYLPCIAWGLKAKEAAQWTVGNTVTLTGRIQSRSYIKLVENEPVAKTAFEVSVAEISLAELTEFQAHA